MKNNLTINGIFYDRLQLTELVEHKTSRPELPQWERDIYNFIREWIDGKETVEVQTSGTTGTPRKCKVTKEAMVVSAKKTLEFFGLKKGDTALLCLSPRYIAGKLMIVRAFEGELDLLITEPSSTPLEGIEREIGFSAMVPMQVQKQIELDPEAFGKLKKLIIGGGEVPNTLKEKLQKILTEVWETYGMTETLTHIALKKVNGSDRSEWFRTLLGVKVSKTEDSRLVVEVEGITDGTLITNDVVEFNKDGGFRILGRADDVINTGGIKVMPQKIEEKTGKWLQGSFVVSSVPDEVLGEKLVLVIEGDEFDANSLLEKMQGMENFEKPKEVMFVDELPRTETGKIKRKELKEKIRKL